MTQPSQIGGDFLHLVDLDIRDASKAGEAWAALLVLWPAARGFPSVVSGSGGQSRHLYFLSPVAMPKRNLVKSPDFITIGGKRKRAWEIDLMGTGSQDVLPPSIHPDTGQPYRWERPLELGLGMWIEHQTLARFGAEALGAAVMRKVQSSPATVHRFRRVIGCSVLAPWKGEPAEPDANAGNGAWVQHFNTPFQCLAPAENPVNPCRPTKTLGHGTAAVGPEGRAARLGRQYRKRGFTGFTIGRNHATRTAE
ncbi:MAG: bifunctional DNA primase/polymerase [Gemmobacter sp.]|uniref:bifunctional DNA primase/polymerase n=1 Tax=Gemmobacter sp. TaxID=1898957 RepID=UPI003919884B